jgi:RNA polymerase sigma-70 factor, ECF subfamily
LDESALLSALRSGDQEAWRSCLQANLPALIGYASRMTGDRASAEEVVQEALVTVYRGLDSFEGRCSLRSWMFRAVRSRALDELRRRGRVVLTDDRDPLEGAFDGKGHWREGPPDLGPDLDRRIDAQRTLAQVRRQVDRLPHDLREVFLLAEVQGLERGEICAALDITPENLRTRLHRARKQLRAQVVRAIQEGV